MIRAVAIPCHQLRSSPRASVRIDTGVFEGGVISMYYDPMIAKLCTHAASRKEAIRLMEDALDNYVVSGLGNNIPFLRYIRKLCIADCQGI